MPETWNDRRRAKRHEKRRLGLCIYDGCNEQGSEGRQYCDKHRAHIAEMHKRWPSAKPSDATRERQKKCWLKVKKEVFDHYGRQCACCGETEEWFLTIDHVNNDGAAHRRELNGTGALTFYLWLRSNGFPVGFQTLCTNCNHAKHRNNGVCPHVTSGYVPDVAMMGC